MALSKDDATPTYRLYGDGPDAGRQFWAHIETIASRSSLHRWEIKPHRHEDLLQLLYIRSGEADCSLGTNRMRILPPAILVLPPGHEHGFRFSSNIDGFVLTLVARRVETLMRLQGLQHVFAQPRIVSLAAELADGKLLSGLIESFFAEFSSRNAGRDTLMDSLQSAIIVLAARLAAKTAVDPNDEAAGNAARLGQLETLILRHMYEHKTAAFYATELGLSVSQLNRVVRATGGQSVHEMIVVAIIDQAKRALLFSQLSVHHIGERLGFADAAYFTRFFTRETGLTPSQFRMRERVLLATATPN